MSEATYTVTVGQSFYPEMGGNHDGSALFERSISSRGYYLKWSEERHAEALAVFKSMRIRPRHVTHSQMMSGVFKWTAGVTWEAGRKLREFSATEVLLD
jgi:hypothetical protein